jgi:mannose-6-phosphate isomerase-like protein (cupin superfamily)
MSLPAALLARATARKALRISPGDTNHFVILFDPETEGYANICVIEIFDRAGRTPPNSHRVAHEFFYVLHGEGVAYCDGEAKPLAKGDALLLRPGSEHVIENVGDSRLYTLTVMTPDEDFAALIRSGSEMELDAEDRAVLAGIAA